MRVTFVGTGDAFGSGARAHTCFRLDFNNATLLVDFGATAILGWKRLGFDLNDIDAIILSHLHGDHFGGLPFLLLESQFVGKRTKPLDIVGPPGLRARLSMLLEALFPGASSVIWRFSWTVQEIAPIAKNASLGRKNYEQGLTLAGFDVKTYEVTHGSGAPATAIRASAGGKIFVYSGDTAWTDHLLTAAASADLFVCECFGFLSSTPGHMDWMRLRDNLSRLSARKILLTHMGVDVLAKLDEIVSDNLGVAFDGLTLDL